MCGDGIHLTVAHKREWSYGFKSDNKTVPIINANHYLDQLLAPAVLERITRLCKFCLRQRTITPAMLVPALLRAMGGDQVNDIAGLHCHFSALQLMIAHQVSYKPFHNQLRKESFALFMKALVERVIALRIDHQLKAASLGAFKQVLLLMASPSRCTGAWLRTFPASSRPSVRRLLSAI